MASHPHDRFVRQAVDLARENVRAGGRPFGALVVKDDVVIAAGVNEVAATGDPTAHAELQAIRAAARALGDVRLDSCVVYASGHPCPMCLGAAYLSGVREVVYAYSLEDAEPYGLSTAPLYADLARVPHTERVRLTHAPQRAGGAVDLYEMWKGGY